MAHTYAGVQLARASSAGNPITVSMTVASGVSVLVLMLKVVGATNRTGAAPTWNGFTFVQANSTQKAATTPEASVEMWYVLNPTAGTANITIPNTGAATIFYEAVGASRGGDSTSSVLDAATGGNNTATNPTPGAITIGATGDFVIAATAGGWQAWSPSGQVGTAISNVDDGADGYGSQYSLNPSTGSFTLSWTFATSDDWGAVVAAFKEVLLTDPPTTYRPTSPNLAFKGASSNRHGISIAQPTHVVSPFSIEEVNVDRPTKARIPARYHDSILVSQTTPVAVTTPDFVFTNHTIAAGTDSTTITSSGINTIGSNFAIVIATYLGNGGTPVISDSQGNVWSDLTAYTTGPSTNATIRISYATLTSTNASHTFQAQGVNSFPAIDVMIFSTSGIVVFDQANGSGQEGASTTTVQPGSITPTTNNQLVVFGAQATQPGATGGSVTAPYTKVDETDYTGFVVFTGGAYAIQTSATATNPTWTFGSTQIVTGAAIASFMVSAASYEMVLGNVPTRSSPVFPKNLRLNTSIDQTTHVTATLSQEMVQGGSISSFSKLPFLDKRGWVISLSPHVDVVDIASVVGPGLPVLPEPNHAGSYVYGDQATGFSSEMATGNVPLLPRLPSFDRKGWKDSQVIHVNATFSQDMVAGNKPDSSRLPFKAKLGWQDSQLTPIVVFSPEMAAGYHPDSPFRFSTKLGQAGLVDSITFAFESILGSYHPDKPNLPFVAQTGFQTSQLTQVLVLSPEMLAGNKPDTPRLPFKAREGLVISQPTYVPVFSSEMAQGYQPERARSPFYAKVGWSDSQLTPVNVLSPEMMAGYGPTSPERLRLQLGHFAYFDIPVYAFESVFAGNRPDSPRLPFKAHEGLTLSQTTPVLVLSPEMLAGNRLDLPRLPFYAKAGWQTSQQTPITTFSQEQVKGWLPDAGRFPKLDHSGVKLSELTYVPVFSPEMAFGQSLRSPRLPLLHTLGWRDSQTTPVVFVSPEQFAGNHPDLPRLPKLDHKGFVLGAPSPILVLTPEMVAGIHPDRPRIIPVGRGWIILRSVDTLITVSYISRLALLGVG